MMFFEYVKKQFFILYRTVYITYRIYNNPNYVSYV
jgi:hypothetical protein